MIQLIAEIWKLIWLKLRHWWRISLIKFQRGLGLVFLALIAIFLGFFSWQTADRLAAIERTLGGRENIGCEASETAKKIQNSLALVIGAYSEGTAFAVSANRLLTNHHVVEYEPSPKVIFPDGTFKIGKVIASDKDNDLAVIQVDRELTPLTWAKQEEIKLGQELLLFGYPYGGEIKGPASVNKGAVAGFRKEADSGRAYLQTNGGLISGMSGGPMTTLCGQVAAVNTAGSNDLGLGIAADVANAWTIGNLGGSEDKNPQFPGGLQDINPDDSAQDTVWVYYQYISARNYEAAYTMLSEHFIGRVSLNDWAKGFETQLQTAVTDIQADKGNKNLIFVYIISKDLINNEVIYHQFEGSWLAKKINGHFKLWESNIKEIPKR